MYVYSNQRININVKLKRVWLSLQRFYFYRFFFRTEKKVFDIIFILVIFWVTSHWIGPAQVTTNSRMTTEIAFKLTLVSACFYFWPDFMLKFSLLKIENYETYLFWAIPWLKIVFSLCVATQSSFPQNYVFFCARLASTVQLIFFLHFDCWTSFLTS